MRLARRHLVPACALLATAALALPSGAAADTATTTGVGGTAAPSGGSAPAPAPAAGGVVLRAAPGALVGRTTRLRGSVPRRLRGHVVFISLYGGNGAWSTVARTYADGAGNYSARWRATRSGRFTLRASVDRAPRSSASPASAAGQALVTVYPSAIATWYGPRSGRVETTACGDRLTATTLGVAHRTLPCGTLVDLYYSGRTVRVPVIDRGPYANNASWDLTIATANWLRFTSVGIDHIGALVVTSRAGG
jgi:rare lipoprotein A